MYVYNLVCMYVGGYVEGEGKDGAVNSCTMDIKMAAKNANKSHCNDNWLHNTP